MKKINIKNKKMFIISIIVAMAIILTSFCIILYFQNNKKITTNMQFEYFGFNEYYENDSNELTINEAGKVLTCIYAQIYDISEIVDTSDGLGLGWQNYAYDMDLITNEEYLNNITCVRLFELIYNYEKTFRNIDENIQNILNIQNEKLSKEQISAINYLYCNDIISKNEINNLDDKVNKKYFEDIVIKCVFKFNLLDLNGDTIDYNTSLNIKENSNYFYLTDNVSKKALNKSTLKIENYEIYLSPKEVYKDIRNDLNEIADVVNGYFNIILNIDYNTISEKTLYDNLNKYLLADYNRIEEYVSFVKENNIKIEGYLNIIYPIVYYIDGEYYIRTEINYNIISSKTKENILFGNISNSTKYIDVKINKNVLGWHISTINMENLQIR